MVPYLPVPRVQISSTHKVSPCRPGNWPVGPCKHTGLGSGRSLGRLHIAQSGSAVPLRMSRNTAITKRASDSISSSVQTHLFCSYYKLYKFTQVLNISIPPFCVKSREYKNFYVTISCTLQISEIVKQDFFFKNPRGVSFLAILHRYSLHLIWNRQYLLPVQSNYKLFILLHGWLDPCPQLTL